MDDKEQNDRTTIPPDSSIPQPIAIVGMGMRLPGGVTSATSLWDLLINKRNGRCVVPPSRYNVDAFYKPSKAAGSVATRHGYFLQDDIDTFDASFFSMNKMEVENVDPQQRLLLEVVWECMETGAQKSWRGGNIGCYVGVFGDVSNTPGVLERLPNKGRNGWILEPRIHSNLDFIEFQDRNRWRLVTGSVMNSISRDQGAEV